MAFKNMIWENGTTPLNEINLNNMMEGIWEGIDGVKALNDLKRSSADMVSYLKEGLSSQNATFPTMPALFYALGALRFFHTLFFSDGARLVKSFTGSVINFETASNCVDNSTYAVYVGNNVTEFNFSIFENITTKETITVYVSNPETKLIGKDSYSSVNVLYENYNEKLINSVALVNDIVKSNTTICLDGSGNIIYSTNSDTVTLASLNYSAKETETIVVGKKVSGFSTYFSSEQIEKIKKIYVFDSELVEKIKNLSGYVNTIQIEVITSFDYISTILQTIKNIQPTPGADGLSAYQTALNNGFEGTEKQWIESLKGKDYVLTDNDKTEIANQVNELIPLNEYVKSVNGKLPDSNGNVTITAITQQPEFVVKDSLEEALTWLSKNGDTYKVYVLPNGYIYKYMTKTIVNEVPNCTNLLDIANVEIGCRLSSSLSLVEDESRSITNAIKVIPGETYTIRAYDVGGVYKIAEFSDIPSFEINQKPTNIISATENIEKVWEDPKGKVYRFEYTVTSETKYIVLNVYVTNESEFADSIITLNEPVDLGTTIVEEKITEWTNTGHSYQPTDYEDKIISLESKLEEHDNRLMALEGDTAYISDYWQTHLDEKVPLIRSAMENAGRKKSAFLFYSDAHWTSNVKNSPKLLKYLHQHTSINKTIFGGDIVDIESDTAFEMAYLYDSWRTSIRNLPNHHSVAGNHDDGNEPDNRFGENYVYAYLLAPEETNDRVDGDGFYYYIDDNCEKTRYLYLDTAYKDAYILSDAQAQFVIDSLSSVPKNYHIVVIGHCWFNQNYDNYPTVTISDLTGTTTKLLELFNAYNNRTRGTLTDLGNVSQSNNATVDYDFTNGAGKVEFCIGGHFHNDYSTFEYGVPIILCEADTVHNRNGSICTAGTTNEQSITAVVADYNNSKINLIRIGRGDNREISL